MSVNARIIVSNLAATAFCPVWLYFAPDQMDVRQFGILLVLGALAVWFITLGLLTDAANHAERKGR